jgi:formylglycine-generating enzyme required for sulfatase activity
VGARLPTAAEWEYAARGPEAYVYPWGNQPPTCEQAQFGGCGGYSVPVGSFAEAGASWSGAEDISGNVWEWVADWYAKYPTTPQTNPTGPETGERRMQRGGSCLSSPDTLHAAYRTSAPRTPGSPTPVFDGLLARLRSEGDIAEESIVEKPG